MIFINLSKLMGEKKWTRAQVAKLTGIRPNTIGDWWLGEDIGKMTLDQVDLFCDLFGCRLEIFVSYLPNKKSRFERKPNGDPIRRIYDESIERLPRKKKKRNNPDK